MGCHSHGSAAVNEDLQIAKLLRLDFTVARTQVRLVFRLVGNAAGWVGGYDFVGFKLIQRGCTSLYDRLCPVLLVFLDLILETARFGRLLTGGERQPKQTEQ